MAVVIPPLITELCSENHKKPAATHLIMNERSGRDVLNEGRSYLIHSVKGIPTSFRVFSITKYNFTVHKFCKSYSRSMADLAPKF